MKTLQISKFKARCLGLLKDVRDTGEPIAVTLRGEPIAIIQPPGAVGPGKAATVSETLRRLRPLLLAEEEELDLPPRRYQRPSATAPFPDES